MAPAQSTLRGQSKEEVDSLNTLLWPAAIPFSKPKQKKKGNKGSEDSKKKRDNYQTFNVKIDPRNDSCDKHNLTEITVPLFEWGTPEDYCQWRTSLEELFNKQGSAHDPVFQVRMYTMLFRGDALEQFTDAYKELNVDNEAKDQEHRLADTIVLEKALNVLALQIFKDGVNSYGIQKKYLRQQIPIGDMDVTDYALKLRTINKWLRYFPIYTNVIDVHILPWLSTHDSVRNGASIPIPISFMHSRAITKWIFHSVYKSTAHGR